MKIPSYVPAVDFYQSIGIRYEQGARLVGLGVLQPDALLNGRPIFLGNLATVEKAKQVIAEYRRRRNRATLEAKELYV